MSIISLSCIYNITIGQVLTGENHPVREARPLLLARRSALGIQSLSLAVVTRWPNNYELSIANYELLIIFPGTVDTGERVTFRQGCALILDLRSLT